MLKTVTAPGVVVFLNTDNIGILLEEVVTHHLKTLFVLVVATIAADIITDYLDGAVGKFLCPEVQGHIYTNRYVREGKTQ